MIGIDELGEACRALDAISEEHIEDPKGAMHRVMPNVDLKAASYIATQRAIRALMILDGQDPTKLSRTETTMVGIPTELNRLLPSFTATFMEGFAVGLRLGRDGG